MFAVNPTDAIGRLPAAAECLLANRWPLWSQSS